MSLRFTNDERLTMVRALLDSALADLEEGECEHAKSKVQLAKDFSYEMEVASDDR